MITDTILRDGIETEVRLIRAACRYLGAKRRLADGSPLLAKSQGCLNTPEDIRPVVFTPVYNCQLFERCCPFEAVMEDASEPAKPCGNCDKFSRLQSGISPTQPPTMKD